MPLYKMTRRELLAGAAGLGLSIPLAQFAMAQDASLSFWYEGATPEQQAALAKYLVEPFNASGKGTLNVEYRGSAVADQLLISLAANEGPDLVLTNGPSWTSRFVAGGRLAPLDEYAEKYGWADKIAKFPLSLGMVDGTLYAIPKTEEVQAMFYNKTLFDANGWTAPKTRAEFEAIADDMLTKNIVPIAAGNSGSRYTNRHYVGIAWNTFSGPEIVYEALAGKRPWTDEKLVGAIQMLKDWWDKGYFGGDKYFSVNSEQAFIFMASGAYGMSMQGTWVFAWVPQSFETTGQELDYTPLPQFGDDAPYPVFPYGVGSHLAINAASPNKDLVAELLNSAVDPAFISNISPGWEGEWDMPLVDPAPAKEGKYAQLAARIRADTSKAVAENTYGYTPWGFWPPKTDQYITGGIEEVWLGQLTPEQFCANVDALFQEDLADGSVRIPPARS